MFACSFAFLLVFLITREGSAVLLNAEHKDHVRFTVPLSESAASASRPKRIIPINISVAPVVLIPVI